MLCIMQVECGILILENNKTYGLVLASAKSKHYYKCIPNNSELPHFLIPYEHKHIGFSKVFKNHYITFLPIEPSSTQKHPIGKLVQNIGPVDILEHFYEYQLYCKNIFYSLQQFTKNTLNKREEIKEYEKEKGNEKGNGNDKVNPDPFIFSIDPLDSLDFDDAVSIKETSPGNYILSIYIANVAICLDKLNLWSSFSNRVSTIYLPDKKHSMLPTILSDNICSLKEGEIKQTLIMDIYLEGREIKDIKYSNRLVYINKNYVYEEPALLALKDYKMLKDVVTSINKSVLVIDDSHQVVEYLMIFMNHKCSQQLFANNCGIFRRTKEIYVGGEYCNDLTINLTHASLNLESYIHITSPIRRLVDLLNIIAFHASVLGNPLSKDASLFYDNWNSKLDFINSSMNSIKKVQNDCNLLYLCTINPAILEQVFEGTIVDKLDDDFVLVYLPAIKLYGKVKFMTDKENYYKLFLFHNEAKMKKKIRVQYI